MDGNNQGGENGATAGSFTWDMAHHPSAGYVAYLVTGEYLYLQDMQDQSAMCFLLNSSSQGSGTSRIFGSQTRGVAWCQRTVGQYVAIAPSDSISSDYQNLLASQVSHWLGVTQRSGINPLGYLYAYELGQYPLPGEVAPWQQHFWVQSYGFLRDIEPFSNSATNTTNLIAVSTWLDKSVAGILGPNGTSNYCFTAASNFNLTVSSSNNGDPTTWFTSWGAVYQATQGSPNSSCGNTLQGSSGGDPANASTGYWGNLMPAIALAVDHGSTGASASWARLSGATNWSTILNSGFADTPVWGIQPR